MNRRRTTLTAIMLTALTPLGACGTSGAQDAAAPQMQVPLAPATPAATSATVSASPSTIVTATPDPGAAASTTVPPTGGETPAPPSDASVAVVPSSSGRAVSASASGARPAAGAFDRPSRGGMRLSPTGDGALSGRIIVIDPGHNGAYAPSINGRLVPAGHGRRKPCNTSGTANSSIREHVLTWKVASALATDLRRRGATVWLTRPDDRGVGPCVNERAAIGNRVGADLVLSIHADGNTSASARGFHVITSADMQGGPETEARSQDLAAAVRDRMATTGMPISTYLGRRGIDVRTDIAGVNLSEPPAVMLEMGNMRHPKDAALLGDSRFRTRVARALADAVSRSLD